MLPPCKDNGTLQCAAQECDILQLHESALKQLADAAESERLGEDSKHYEVDSAQSHYCSSAMLGANPTNVAKASPVNLECPEYLAHRLLVEFGKTRTNYNSLVPRIVEVMRLYRDFGPMRCPVPVVSNLEELLNDEALIRIEHRYPNSLDAGFLVLCTERRALRSGGGGKYYFIDVSGRLVGCHKSDLPSYADKGILRGPVLLKNLIFVFIMRGAFGLDPRCKSSNPQRLLEYYENLAKEGKAMDVQRLVRVWSMEIFPEAPYDAGFPHCSLLWVKRMHVGAHITKWKRSQWHTNQLRAQDVYSHARHAQVLSAVHSQYLHTGEATPVDCYRGVQQLMYTPNKRRRVSEAYSNPSPTTNYDAWRAPSVCSMPEPQLHGADLYDNAVCGGGEKESTTPPNFPSSDFLWDAQSIQTLYTTFNQFAPALQKADIMDWSTQIVERLSPPILAAAMQLVTTSFEIRPEEDYDEKDASAFRSALLRTVSGIKEREKMAESLRILMACLVQQQRLEEFLPNIKHGQSNNTETLTPPVPIDGFYNVFVKLEGQPEGGQGTTAPAPSVVASAEPETSSTAESNGNTVQAPLRLNDAIDAYGIGASSKAVGQNAELAISPTHRDDLLTCNDQELWKCFTMKKDVEQQSKVPDNTNSLSAPTESTLAELLCNSNYLYRQGSLESAFADSPYKEETLHFYENANSTTTTTGSAGSRRELPAFPQPSSVDESAPPESSSYVFEDPTEECHDVDVTEYNQDDSEQDVSRPLISFPIHNLLPSSLSPFCVLSPCHTTATIK